MEATAHLIKKCVNDSNSRIGFWVQFLQAVNAQRVVELGVYRGDYAQKILRECNSITRYYMIDPWRHLNDWNKPANKEDNVFEAYLAETKLKTDFAGDKRVILRGTTTEVVHNLDDSAIDFAYVDGDHTLRGITVDLIRLFPKIKNGGFLGGDDFSPTVWQHATKFEPTLVFPFAVYFAEAVGARIYALPGSQFLLEKNSEQSFDFVDLTAKYSRTTLREQFHVNKVLRLKFKEALPFPWKVASRIKKMVNDGF